MKTLCMRYSDKYKRATLNYKRMVWRSRNSKKHRRASKWLTAMMKYHSIAVKTIGMAIP